MFTKGAMVKTVTTMAGGCGAMEQLQQYLEHYLQLLQQQNADDNLITEVKSFIWEIETDRDIQRFLNNLSLHPRRKYR